MQIMREIINLLYCYKYLLLSFSLSVLRKMCGILWIYTFVFEKKMQVKYSCFILMYSTQGRYIEGLNNVILSFLIKLQDS